jgi:DNA-directed RNA polymerase subunit RPC12/RpoP/predicted RNA-binding Zn-ribbon protein involved in translation (DUF1610 family)
MSHRYICRRCGAKFTEFLPKPDLTALPELLRLGMKEEKGNRCPNCGALLLPSDISLSSEAAKASKCGIWGWLAWVILSYPATIVILTIFLVIRTPDLLESSKEQLSMWAFKAYFLILLFWIMLLWSSFKTANAGGPRRFLRLGFGFFLGLIGGPWLFSSLPAIPERALPSLAGQIVFGAILGLVSAVLARCWALKYFAKCNSTTKVKSPDPIASTPKNSEAQAIHHGAPCPFCGEDQFVRLSQTIRSGPDYFCCQGCSRMFRIIKDLGDAWLCEGREFEQQNDQFFLGNDKMNMVFPPKQILINKQGP